LKEENKQKQQTNSAADVISHLSASMQRNGADFGSDVEATNLRKNNKGASGYDAPTRTHQAAQKQVADVLKEMNVEPTQNLPVMSDGDSDVIPSSEDDYREEVQLRPHSVPHSSKGKETRLARKNRGDSPGSYKQATPMAEYNNKKSRKGSGKKGADPSKPAWAELKTQCHALRRNGKQCGNTSRKGSKFCHLKEHSAEKQGVPDYADDPAYKSAHDTNDRDSGPLPEALRRPLLWVWGNFYTPFSWMVVWVFATAMSAKGVFGRAVLAPYHLMNYTVESVACKYRWKHTVAILTQAMGRKKPLLGVGQVLQVLGSHKQIRDSQVVYDTTLTRRIHDGIAHKEKGKWKGRDGAKQAKKAGALFDDLVSKRREQNIISAFFDPNGPNANCIGLDKFKKEDGTPNMKAARKKFGKMLTTPQMLRDGKRVSPVFLDPKFGYEYFCGVSDTLNVTVGNSEVRAYTRNDFVDAYVAAYREKMSSKYDVFYLVNKGAERPKNGKKGLDWVSDPVVIQIAVYNENETGKLFLGVGRETKTGYDGPFESLFLRTSKRSPFEHVWDADDELDVFEHIPSREDEIVANMMDTLQQGAVLGWEEILAMQV
jgi:hypothetical protein